LTKEGLKFNQAFSQAIDLTLENKKQQGRLRYEYLKVLASKNELTEANRKEYALLSYYLNPALKEEGGSHMDIMKGFKPERWLDNDTKPTKYTPFGEGPRYCLDVNLALVEMKVFFALFTSQVDFNMTNTTPENVEWKRISIIPKPKDGALISVLSMSNPCTTTVV
jgi:hypothetical protein